MPIMRYDKSTGAIIFDLTPEEKKIQDLEQRLAQMETLEKRLQEIEKHLSKGG